ncbi:hypothetical protein QTI17_29335 [Variovorax sp. J31P179]|uniref:DUF4286 family protein n=1 Tax=Variovorax sp. J31P179 TaxID=3053508 RepID=UPI0025767A0C|nr:DUF4286 family protein [Variovorax sp. J31P179]MDM0084710.1 hypothetical protein [Variovorax sp. J31P179]
MSRHLMCVMTSPTAGKEQEFQRWYNDQHVPDVMRLPGVLTGQRFRLSSVQHKAPPFAQNYVALYDIESDDLEGFNAEIARRFGTPEMPMSDALALPVVRFLLDPDSPLLRTDGKTSSSQPENRHLMCVMTTPADGKEAEFTRWYDEQHIPDLMRMPGLLSAQRFRLSATQHKAPPFPQTYLAIYELGTDDLSAFNADLLSRVGTAAMPLTDALGPGFVRFLLDSITPRWVNEASTATEPAVAR